MSSALIAPPITDSPLFQKSTVSWLRAILDLGDKTTPRRMRPPRAPAYPTGARSRGSKIKVLGMPSPDWSALAAPRMSFLSGRTSPGAMRSESKSRRNRSLSALPAIKRVGSKSSSSGKAAATRSRAISIGLLVTHLVFVWLSRSTDHSPGGNALEQWPTMAPGRAARRVLVLLGCLL
jgi:hypothetical protein